MDIVAEYAKLRKTLFSSNPPPGSLKSQLIISRTYKTLVEVNCVLQEQTQFVPVVNVVNPVFLAPGTVSPTPDAINGDPTNATLALQPGDSALVTLRLVGPTSVLGTAAVPGPYNPATAVTPAVVAQASNTGTTAPCAAFAGVPGFIGAYQMQNWTAIASNGGTTAITPPGGLTQCATFGYNINLNSNPATGCCGGGVSLRTWTFQTTAANTGTATFQWHYTGFHTYFAVTALFHAFSGNATPITLYSAGPVNCCTSPSNGFDVSGIGSIAVTQGMPFGFIVGGSNGDSNSQLNGTLTITNFSAP